MFENKANQESQQKNGNVISVIVPVYNVQKYLSRCIDSILNQTYKNLQIILVDDGSTDLSGKMCDEIAEKDARVTVIHKANGGLSSARNAGLEVVSGAYVAFVDSDDWIESDTFEYMLNLIKGYDVDIADVECQYSYSEQDKIDVREEKISVYKNMDVLWNFFERGLTLQRSAPYSVWRKLYKSTLVSKRRFLEGKNSEDLYFNYEVLKETESIVVSNIVKYHYFQNSNGISIGPLKKIDLSLLSICKTICEKEKNNTYKDINKLTEIKLARSYFSLLARVAKAGYEKRDFPDIYTYIKQWTTGLRKNYRLLMTSSIPFNRKILISIFSINYNIVAFPMKLKKRIKG